MRKAFLLLSLGFLVLAELNPGPATTFAMNEEGSSDLNLRVMTYNVRFMNNSVPSPYNWDGRRPLIRKVIRSHMPDIIGTQEPLFQQVKEMGSDLPEYDWIGLGKEGGSKGLFMPIFYKKTRFTPLEYDHYWLSDAPETIGSRSWGNINPRMVTWVKFLDLQTNQSFYFINTHLDHISEESRRKSTTLIIKKMKELDPALPVLITGDFNVGPESVVHQKLTKEGPFTDLWEIAESRINEDLGTFNAFRDPTGGGPKDRIDWILSKGKMTVHEIAILDDREEGRFPSDHYPVMAGLTLHYAP
ncbi:endonuclease/exonuclease/phosphatase family protein [Pseudalkalibacillus salsuginis]|uniref:endonuclease/exonuclease/phosphatase family protein n=1 Tax=Pseudalkalibacillus salsuginis TaxID=2910972 RepID=UPI001F46C902|nr:endonuclease/exonuclease/phosphatase family protein [Pseudalkalibacillus salsuginis]MCF6409462.1 endonuclease/exonuclease/phosphatase family protein [Pseudalkalibacillus salsuginis]